MGQGLFVHKRMRIGRDLTVWVSNSHHYDDFGIRSRFSRREEDRTHRVGRFISKGVPGTGFFERDTESESYQAFVRKYTSKTHFNYLRYLTGKEFSFDKELQLVENKLSSTEGDNRKRFLEMYSNCLSIARQAELLERQAVAVKRKMGNRPTKATSSALSHLKNRLARLEHEIKACQFNLDTIYSPEVMTSYSELSYQVGVAMNSRRIYSLRKTAKGLSLVRVFWDMGVFDYVRSSVDTPVMRGGDGTDYYAFPDGIVAARSTVDFDFHPWRNLTVIYRETSGESLTMSIDGGEEVYGRQLGEVYIDELDLNFYFAHRSVARHLVKAIVEYQTFYSNQSN